MKIAYVFAGQGSQYSGMGSDLYEKYPESRTVFDAAGDHIKELCFHGSAEELKETQNTQPCVYTMTMAAYEAFKARTDIQPQAVAGFSLGEYSAMTAAGIISDISAGVELMENRGRWMAEAGCSPDGTPKGTMAAAIGDLQKILDCVEAVKGDDILTAANFNAPSQTVVSGDIEAVERFTSKAKDVKLRVTPLAVGSAFHSPMMEPASDKMRNLIISKKDTLSVSTSIPVYSNLTAKPISEYRAADGETQTVEDIADAMAKQLMSPVRWVEIIQELISQGIDTFVEFGPGKTLCGLIKKIDRSVNVYNVENCETLENTIAELAK
jgi:[acyl-carrier-protein] S-malonyltransferase